MIDTYNVLGTDGKAPVDKCLRALGGEFTVASIQQHFANRVERRKNRLVWAN